MSIVKSVQLELPEKTAMELESLVKNGWFASETEIIRLALTEFVKRYRFALQEKFQMEDVAWAMRQSGNKS